MFCQYYEIVDKMHLISFIEHLLFFEEEFPSCHYPQLTKTPNALDVNPAPVCREQLQALPLAA